MASASLSGGSAENFAGLAGSNMLTTTSQYAVVGMNTASTTSNFTFSVLDTTTTHAFALGINQTFLSSGAASSCNVRMLGISKAIAGGTITAGSPLVPSGAGRVVVLATGVTATAVSTTSHIRTIGWALESAATAGAELLIFVNPQLVVKTYA